MSLLTLSPCVRCHGGSESSSGLEIQIKFHKRRGGGDARVGGYQTLITGLEKNYANVVHFSRVGLRS